MMREEENLYKKVKNHLCRKIFDGTYPDGGQIPPERKLSEELGVSRVTTRKALKILEEERIISRVQGSGTRVSMHYGARRGDMEIITLVASAQNDFFTSFLDAFQTEADQWGSLVLYKQKPSRISLGECLYQLHEKGLYNIVLWPEDMRLRPERLKILRGLGMDLVLFDAPDGGAYADAVCMDNREAVVSLHTRLRQEGCEKIAYIGWDNSDIGSLWVREQTFRELEPEGAIYPISYGYHNRLYRLPEASIRDALACMEGQDGIIYAVGELGMVFEEHAKRNGIVHRAGMIGAMPGAKELGIHVVAQDFTGMARQIFKCLQRQNQEDVEDVWEACAYLVKGQQQF